MAKDKNEVRAKKEVKKLEEAGWVLYNPFPPSLSEQILEQWKKTALPSKYDMNHSAYLIATQSAISDNIEDAYKKARISCSASIAALLKSEVAAATEHQMKNVSRTDGTQTEENIRHIMSVRSKECLQGTEDGIILYRQVKDGYEVQMTLLLCTDKLSE